MIAVMVYPLQASVHVGMPLPLDRRPRGVAELHVAVQCVSLSFSIKKKCAEANQIGTTGSMALYASVRLGKITSRDRFHKDEKDANDPDWALKVYELQRTTDAYLVQGHSVLDKESNATVEVANIALEDKVLL
jgi:hypothetical protein